MASRQDTALVRVERQLRQHPGGEFMDWLVIDNRTGEDLAMRTEPESALEVAEHLNAAYRGCSAPPAHDTLVREIVGLRITGEPPEPLHVWASDEVNLCGLIPESVGGPLDTGLWRPCYEEEA